MRVDILDPRDSRWSRVLCEAKHEFYHLPRYAHLEAGRLGGRGCAILAVEGRHQFLLPLLFREVVVAGQRLTKNFDAVSPYGYPGPITTGGGTRFVRDAITATMAELRDANIISLFVRTSPILNDPDLLRGEGTVVHHGETVWLDLTLSWDDLRRQMRGRYRSYLNSIDRERVTVRYDEDFANLSAFVALYHNTMRRVGAAGWYFLPEDYFVELKKAVGAGLKLCVVEDRGRVVAAGLFAECNGIVEYLFSGHDVNAGVPHATRLMIVFVRDWAKEQGCSVLHLGGGLGARDDRLLQFKRGFSKVTSPFFTWRVVIDREAYDRAVQRWIDLGGLKPHSADEYFPVYRRPVAID